MSTRWNYYLPLCLRLKCFFLIFSGSLWTVLNCLKNVNFTIRLMHAVFNHKNDKKNLHYTNSNHNNFYTLYNHKHICVHFPFDRLPTYLKKKNTRERERNQIITANLRSFYPPTLLCPQMTSSFFRLRIKLIKLIFGPFLKSFHSLSSHWLSHFHVWWQEKRMYIICQTNFSSNVSCCVLQSCQDCLH